MRSRSRSVLPLLLAASAAVGVRGAVQCQLRLAADTPLWLDAAPAAPVEYELVGTLRRADGRLVLDIDYAVDFDYQAAGAESVLREAISGALGGAAVTVDLPSRCEVCAGCPSRCECADTWLFPCAGGAPPELVQGCAVPSCAAPPGMPPLCGAVDPNCEPDPAIGGEGVAQPLAGGGAAFLCAPACADDQFGSQAFPGETGAGACARLVLEGVVDRGSAEAACAAEAATAPLPGMLLRQLCPVSCDYLPAGCGSATLLPLRASAVGLSGLLAVCLAGNVLNRLRGPQGWIPRAGAGT